MAASGVRVTVVTAKGQVLADSQSDPSTMENHADRPEIRDAFAKGEGQSIRHSVTINRNLLYYAVRQNLATGEPVVLRFALPVATVDEVLDSFRHSLWLSSFVILLISGAASLLVSRRFADLVDRLQEFSRRVAQGDFRPLLPHPAGAALDKLSASLIETSARLDLTIRALSDDRNFSAAILG